MAFVGFRYSPIIKMDADFILVGERSVPVLAGSMDRAGDEVLTDARRRFVSFGGGKQPYQFSAEHFRSGVVTGRERAVASVGQTLPRAEIAERRRPAWSLLQYEKALGPAVDSKEEGIARHVEGDQAALLRAYGFV